MKNNYIILYNTNGKNFNITIGLNVIIDTYEKFEYVEDFVNKVVLDGKSEAKILKYELI